MPRDNLQSVHDEIAMAFEVFKLYRPVTAACTAETRDRFERMLYEMYHAYRAIERDLLL